MSKNYWLAISMGTAGLVLAYCIYFDRKRRSQPDYKAKVHFRRQQNLKKKLIASGGEATQPMVLQSGEQTVLDECFFSEIKLGQLLISSGKLSEGLGHVANAIMLCAQPMPVLQTLKETLPDRLFQTLILKLKELQELKLAAARAAHS